MRISQAAFEFIIAQEVSSKAYYERWYTHPEWPGGASGITIAIGYDLGYASASKIRTDWQHLVSADMLLVMLRCSRINGLAAKRLLPEVKDLITIRWDIALSVFAKTDIPNWTTLVCKTLPNTDKLSPTCLGVLVSLAYNRGAGGFDSAADRFTEMRTIKHRMVSGQIPGIPGDLISMERLWPDVRGLRLRREAEAKLFQQGLVNPGIEASLVPLAPSKLDYDLSLNEGAARTKPPATTTAQHSTAGAIVVGSIASANAADFPFWTVTMVGVGAALVAGIVWWLWYRNRNPT